MIFGVFNLFWVSCFCLGEPARGRAVAVAVGVGDR